VGPTEGTKPQPEGLDRDKVQALTSRLRELRKRWAQEQGGEDLKTKATEVLDAVLADLDEAQQTPSGSTAAEDVDLGLAMVEEMFEAEGSQGFSRVIASIRASLIPRVEEHGDDEEPPPPVRYQPPSSVAVRRRRPKPKPETPNKKVSTPAPPRKGRLGWFIIAVFVIASAGVVAFLQFQKGRSVSQEAELTEPATGSRPLVSGMPVLVLPQEDTRPSWAREDFDVREEEMATFTFEIRLAEEAMAQGDFNEALRHFAAAAAIDRPHPRVVVTGKFLIASMMREGDLAHDAGDAKLAKKRFQSARSLARGLSLEDESNRPDPTEVGFEDLDPTRDGVLQGVVGLPVRLTFKTGDVVYGRGDGMDGDHLLLEVYAGTRAGGAERSMKILASTIEGIRVY
jgi:hypothetical protein